MSWFDEQLKYRQQKDDDAFADAIESIAEAVMGKRLRDSLNDHEAAQSAIDEILKAFRMKRSAEEIPVSCKTLEDRLDFCMRPLGISYRTVKLGEKWYRDAIGPMLGTLKADGTSVALLPREFAGYVCIDPRSGKQFPINRHTAELLDEEALCFYQPLPLKKLNVADLIRYMLEQMRMSDFVLLFGLAGISTLLGMLSPVLTRWLFGDVLESGSQRVLLALAGFMICFSVSQVLLGVYRTLINSRIGMRQSIAVQAAVMNRIMSLPARFFKDYSAGELTSRAGNVQSLCSMLFDTVGSVGITSLFSLAYVGQITVYAPRLLLPALTITLLNVIITLVTTLVQMKVTKEIMQHNAKTSGMTYSMITGIQKIKLAGAEKRMFARWARQYAKGARLQYNPPMLLRLSGTISLAVSLFGTMVLYDLAIRSGVSVADYNAFNSAYAMVSGAFMSLVGITTTLANIRPTLEMAKPILETEPETAEGRTSVTSLRGGIEMNNVCFRYSEDMPNVIEHLNLKVRPGEYLAVVGSTGCGKSTLLRLLLGFETPQKGAIYYDRQDISRTDLKSLRRQIGVVMQDGKLFTGSIYDNIVISAPHLTLNEAWEAAENAAVADDIRRMPMGMNTMISDGQGGISGGQRQRLMIARAIAPKPKILMFDEATSALDNVTQKKVSEAIDKLNCTRIVIAHRLSTIRHCDRIIVLDHGRIVEEGNYEQLIEKNGFFAELVARQRLDVEN